ncbi:MAG: hypothetical protein U0231_07745 [Nitrospiraceae bacterium]
MKVSLRVFLFFQFSDFDDGLGALVQQSKDLVIDPVDFCPMPLQIV